LHKQTHVSKNKQTFVNLVSLTCTICCLRLRAGIYLWIAETL